MELTNIALAFGSSLTAGFKLYMTVWALGLMDRFEVVNLPERLEILSHPWVLGTASVLLVIEFFADKIPYVDNTWDTIHSFIRVPAGALLAADKAATLSDGIALAAKSIDSGAALGKLDSLVALSQKIG